MVFFQLIDQKLLEWLLFCVHKVVTTEIHQSKTLLFSKRKLAVTWLQKSRISYLMHSTSLLELLKETSCLRLWLMPSAESLFFLNEMFSFSLMSKIRLWSYSALIVYFGLFLKLFGLLGTSRDSWIH